MRWKHVSMLLWAVVPCCVAAGAQTKPAAPKVAAVSVAAGTAEVMMLSDLHFDPFQDPAKVTQLMGAPVEKWTAIFEAPESATRAVDFGKLTAACRMRGSDSSWTLLEASLKAARARAPHPLFVTVSGDLMMHYFDCRMRNLMPKISEAEYSDFAAKTVSYVTREVRRTFPGAAVYFALGNNDSGCGDYHESAQSGFLKNIQEGFAAEAKGADFSVFNESGSYSAPLPAPVERGRMIVLQNIFEAATFTACGGKQDGDAAAAQITWLRKQLQAAHEKNEQVWVMAHIPPGVDIYNTLAKRRNVCGGESPVMFLGNEALAEVLTEFAPEIRLALFGHTHMDEMRVFEAAKKKGDTGPPMRVVGKLVPSISPVNGNTPAFTVAEVNEKTAVLQDYRVFAADTMAGANWSEEYRFSTTYHQKAYTADTVAPLIAGFRADKESAAPESNAYEQFFMVNGGLRSLAMRLVWPQYACGLDNNTVSGFRACFCALPQPGAAKP